MLNTYFLGTYFCPKSIKIENQVVSTKALHFLLICVNENFQNQSLIYVQVIKELL